MTWDDWRVRHARIFGMLTDHEMQMLVEWIRVLQLEGMTPDELSEASDHLARNGHPTYRADFLRPLMDAVRAARVRKTGREDLGPRPAPSDGCGLCGGSGVVCGLPNFEEMERLASMFPNARYTCCVWCKCPLGRWNAKVDPRGRMGYEEYARIHPNYRETLEEWKAKDAAKRTAGAWARAIDSKLGPLMEHLRAKKISGRR